MRTAVRPRKAAATVPQAGCLDQPHYPTLAQRFDSTTLSHSSLLRRGSRTAAPGFDGSPAGSHARAPAPIGPFGCVGYCQGPPTVMSWRVLG